MRTFLLLVIVGVLSIGLGIAHSYVPVFKARMDLGADTNPYSIATGDTNGYGHPNLAVANEGSNKVSVLLS